MHHRKTMYTKEISSLDKQERVQVSNELLLRTRGEIYMHFTEEILKQIYTNEF